MEARTEERIAAVAAAFALRLDLGVAGPESLRALLEGELGHEEALDRFVPMPRGGMARAMAPCSIYHICAGNLAVSAETSLLLGLLLGSELFFKMPEVGLPDFERTVAGLPGALREKVVLLKKHDEGVMKSCEAVVVYGSDKTVGEVAREVDWRQRFVTYGHKISIGYLPASADPAVWAELAVREILAYDQLGCLSPQSYLCEDPDSVPIFGYALAEALERTGLMPSQLPFEASALVFEARQRAELAGDKVHVPHSVMGWTVVERRRSAIEPGPGYGFVEVVPLGDWAEVLTPWLGYLSSVGVAAETVPASLLTFWQACGISRVCRMGRLQQPPLNWRHDGRPRLADLVTWQTTDPEITPVAD